MLRAFPLLLIAVILYNIVAFGGALVGYPDMAGLLSQSTTIKMFSGDQWTVTGGDLLLFLTFSLLFVEVVKSTCATSREMINHALSLLTFIAALIEFLMVRGFSTSVFFFIMLMTLFDVTAGYSISVLAARRDLDIHRIDEN